jgi:hypothetical protein
MTGPCNPLSFALPSNTSRGSANYGPPYVFFPPSCHILHFNSTYSQRPLLKYPQFLFFPRGKRPSFVTIEKQSVKFYVPVALCTSILESCMHCPPTCFRRSQYNIITFLVKRRHAVYVRRNTEVYSPNNCYHGKAIRITYSECVS